ncbi:DNA-binding MarR family transcriptional regulator [Nonomuraea thailandensis]|uniref:DNA-binding MarR family transcriptional regulator n=1 Tax=Nonomuraea thailandensis TaxID=1188745 RepID=A0A9X2G7U0_9ACTN|nr:MarR family transcriptional regulator [Nonomuraea thailandensis]MCP2354137.1 DNA-binding MarR family transcriptional regulator [Nonomuraea thailandensis]
MRQDDATRTVGYQLKRVQAALRAAMDAALRAHGLTTPQYVCLELLGRHPRLSNAELARGAFVTRQSMNVVLRNLEDAGLVSRPSTAPSGRALPTRLTAAGERVLEAARADVLAIERRMTAGLDRAQAEVLLRQLNDMADALSEQG